MDLKGRTQGDGMENIELIKSDDQRKLSENSLTFDNNRDNERRIPGATSIYRHDDKDRASVKLPAQIPKGKQFYLIPHLVNTKKNFSLKNKEPRFVPFEPYKAAVSPMVPVKLTKKQRINRRNNLDLNTLVSHVSNLTTNEFKCLNSSNLNADENAEMAAQNLKYERQIADLKKERDSLDNQLKFQVQVNSELKNLLVAAVGEDLQTKVNVLTEELCSTQHHKGEHMDQVEWLTSQVEVFRSKFLASSLMLEELARWKASLMQKNKLLLESNKQMLETISQLRDMQIGILKNLQFMAQIKHLNLPSSNVLDLTNECLNISEKLVLHSGIGMPANLELNQLDAVTSSEKMAIEAIEQSGKTLISSDEALKAVVNQAFPQTKTPSAEKQTQTVDNNTN